MSENQINQTNLAIAALASCFAKALEEQSPGFIKKLEEQLHLHHSAISESGTLSNIGAMETLKWTSEFLRDV
ncbi:MAG: hypothetical protein ACTS8S_23295 [Giesbergeria sp.]